MARSAAQLFEREYEPMVRLAFLLTGSSELAEDVVADAFLAVHERWDRLLNPAGYLRRSVVNLSARTAGRSARRRAIVRENSRVIRPRDSESEPEYLLDALERLPERQRVALVLAYYGRYRADEIAEALGCRPGTAKSLVHRGLKQMRKELGDA